MSTYTRQFRPRSSSSFGGGQRTKRYSAPKRRNQKQYINPAKFVQKATMREETTYRPKFKFGDFEVTPLIKANIQAKGFEDPSAIQDQTIPMALQGKDVIGIANTGTGKTAAFAIPLLHRLITNPRSKAIVMAPTRELAQQIEQEFRALGKGTGLNGALLIGGTPIGPQMRDLRQNPRVIIGTPGRIKDHLERTTLNLRSFDFVVLDEVDRMLDMGFVHDITEILSQIGQPRQSLFFSATMDSKVERLIQQFSNDAVTVSVKTSASSENVNQDVISYGSKMDRLEKLHNLLNEAKVEKIIVFDDTQRDVESLSNELVSRGFSADAIHGGKSQGQRQRALNRFKTNQVNILVATDVAARGIDVKDITHVVNYSVPQSYDDYIHRIGRAGRAGKIGHALTFVTS